MAVLRFLALSAALAAAVATQPLSPANKLFGHAIKGGELAPYPYETTAFQYNCTAAPCVVTQVHVPSIYPGSGCNFDWENGRMRVYVDGEATASIDVSLLEIANIGAMADTSNNPPGDATPWGNELFGKTSITGGVYSTVRIPFSSSITFTIQPPKSCSNPQPFWFIVRGIESMPVQLGSDFTLPASARLRMYRNTNVTVNVLDFIQVAGTVNANAGALLSARFDAVSSEYTFLEACIRFYPNNASTPIYLSSGTEDFFLSASYFDEGRFNTPESGLSFKQDPGTVSAYKVFTRDYVVFQNGFNLTWRNMENSCPDSFPWNEGQKRTSPDTTRSLKLAPAVYNSLVFWYEWSASDNEYLQALAAPLTRLLMPLRDRMGPKAFSSALAHLKQGDVEFVKLLNAHAGSKPEEIADFVDHHFTS